MNLTGKETVRLFGRFAETECSTQDIANLAAGGPGTSLTITGAKANILFGVVPANAYLLVLYLREGLGQNVSVAIGTTLGGSDVMSAQPVSGGGTLTVNPFQSPNWFSATAAQALYLTFSNGSGFSINAELDFKANGP